MIKAVACALTAVAILSLSTYSIAGVMDIKESEYNDEVVKSSLPVVLEFWAYYCPDCLQSSQAIEALADEYAGRMNVLSMNADENPLAAARYDIKTLPVFIYIKDGKVVSHATGPMTSKEELKEKLGLPEQAPAPVAPLPKKDGCAGSNSGKE